MDTPLPPIATRYGSDEHGLICGFHFVPDAAPRALQTMAEAAPLMVAEAPGFVWLHINLAHAGAMAWLHDHAGVSDNFFEALADGSRSTRIERDGVALFAVVNDVTYDFSFDPGDIATLWLSVRERLVVSARRHPLRAVDRLRTALKRGETLASATALLTHLMADQADELQRIVRRAAERVEDIEDELLSGHHPPRSPELARLRRLAVRLQRLLAPEPAALQRTLSHPPAWVAQEDLQHLHRASEEFALVLRDIAALQERVKLVQDEAATHVNEENNRSLFMLTMVTVLALPINLVAGLLGMNVGGIPLGDHPHGFWLTLAIIVLLTGGVAWLVLRRLKPR